MTLLLAFATTARGQSVTGGSLPGGSIGQPPPDDTAYNATTWNGSLRSATKNAIRDKFEALSYAPTDATYITQTANGTLSAEQAMGALGTGAVWNTTTTGVQSISAGLTSLGSQVETNGGLPYGTADNAYAWLGAGTANYVLQANGAAAPSWATSLNLTAVAATNLDGTLGGNTPAAVTGTTGTFSGVVSGAIGTYSDADGHTMTATQCLGYNFYSTAAQTWTMCPAVAGANFTLEVMAAGNTVFNPDNSGTEDTIILNGTALAQGDGVTCTLATDFVVVTYYAADTWSMRATAGCTDTN